MNFHKHAVCAGGNCRTGQSRCKLTLSPGTFAGTAGKLDAVRNIKYHRPSGILHNLYTSEIDHEIVVSEHRSPFRDQNPAISCGGHLFDDINNIPWREKLSFFNVQWFSGFGNFYNQVCLSA